MLHHIGNSGAAVANLVASARPGGAILLIQLDFLPVTIAEPPEIRAFWDGWLAWSRAQGIDYVLGRRPPAMLAEAGLTDVRVMAETAVYNGGSNWASYWTANDHGAASSPRGLGQAGRPRDRRVPRTVHRSALVDPDHRLYRRRRAPPGAHPWPNPRVIALVRGQAVNRGIGARGRRGSAPLARNERADEMGDFFGVVAAGPFFFVSSWVLMLFVGGFACDVGIKPIGYLTSMVVTIALWLTLAPAIGAIARTGRSKSRSK